MYKSYAIFSEYKVVYLPLKIPNATKFIKENGIAIREYQKGEAKQINLIKEWKYRRAFFIKDGGRLIYEILSRVSRVLYDSIKFVTTDAYFKVRKRSGGWIESWKIEDEEINEHPQTRRTGKNIFLSNMENYTPFHFL